MTDWTRDADGNFVDWTKPPHYERGILNLVLPGERLVSPEVLSRRRWEYVQLTRRRMSRRKDDAAGPAQSSRRRR